MAEVMKDIARGASWFMWIILFICAGLVVAGFLLPPLAQIDGSVLKAVGELGGLAWLYAFTVNIPLYIEKGATARFSHGDKTIEITTNKENNGE